MARPSSQPVVMIELLRFVCAGAVMACHYGVGFWRAPGVRPALLLDGIEYRPPFETGLQFGWLGVEIFFVISGMMIARSAVGSTAGGFLRRRALRLAPAAWACGTVTLAVLIAGLGPDGALLVAWGRSVAFWPAGQQIDAAYWTLGIELAFYLAVAASLGRRGPAHRIERVGAVIGSASGLFWIGCVATGPAAGWLFTNRAIQLMLLPYGCFFALGIVIARCQAAGVTPARAVALATFLAIGALEVAVHAIESANESGLPVAKLAALALFAAAVLALMLAGRAQPLLSQVVRPATARTIGLMTYPLYLVHQEAGAVLVAVLTRAGLVTGAALLVTAAAAIVTAWLVARFAEPRLRHLLADTFDAAGRRIQRVDAPRRRRAVAEPSPN
jgi:peptidoglycan/LPS O-acetylase OafA/YrhL